ncbi:hypothetical protein WFK_00179 [Escherichia phage vB_EcoM_WFK]|nr:hypothetical protein WFL6982_00179 [Escherichia phage vB_EcoM_WFL6982]QBQ77201.1 hypothetical protein WFK_00179 [Escherichia phage vB_EcoM_WFK]
MAFTVDITPKTPTGVIDETKQFTATPGGETGGGTITYAWSVDDVPQDGAEATFSYVLKGPAGQKTIKVVATNTVPEGELPYVHPLPHRTSAYIWCGWWVMDEIQKMTEEGKDWKTEDPDSKYYLHRYTLQKMMKDYPEVDVQESRNGYIIHKTALETGIIYTYP